MYPNGTNRSRKRTGFASIGTVHTVVMLRNISPLISKGVLKWRD